MSKIGNCAPKLKQPNIGSLATKSDRLHVSFSYFKYHVRYWLSALQISIIICRARLCSNVNTSKSSSIHHNRPSNKSALFYFKQLSTLRSYSHKLYPQAIRLIVTLINTITSSLQPHHADFNRKQLERILFKETGRTFIS